MHLNTDTLEEIKRNSRLRNLLALELGCTDWTILRWVKENNDNLTKAAALQVIRKETGWTDDQILEARNTQVGQKTEG